MKGWKLKEPFSLEFIDTKNSENDNTSKIKITKALITLSDVLRYNGEIDVENVVLGSYGIGVVTEANANLFCLEKGNHVYIEPTRPCKNCHNCKLGEESKCSDFLTAGEDFDGFLRDFASVDAENLYLLPESVSDFEALFIGKISLAVAIIDKLNIQKGDYVSIIGANNFANILAQLLRYYQAVPIVMSNNEEALSVIKQSGIYYTLGPEDNWQKEVSTITGGRMTKSVIYIADCNIPVSKAFALASFNADVAFTGVSYKNNPVSFFSAVKKQLNIHCMNIGFKNTATSINLIANKAIKLSHLKLDTTTFDMIPKTLKTMSEQLENDGKIYETIVDLI